MNDCAAIKENIRITDYAAELGFTVVRKGRYFSLKEHDSVIIDPQRNCFWRNSRPGSGNAIGAGGSVIDFAVEFGGLTLAEAIRFLGGRVPPSRRQKPADSPVKKESGLCLPEAAPDMHRVFAYLIKSRGIDAGIVQEMVKRKQLYQDIHGNCVFVSYDREKKAVFACRRGTNTQKPFYGDVKGCDYRQCFFYNNDSDKLYITESVIDALSIMTLLQKEAGDWNYLSLAGIGKYEAVEWYLQDPELKLIRIGTDNDKSGKKSLKELESKIRILRPDITIIPDIPDIGKDWNDVLRKRKEGENASFCRQ